jgi:hypothetical protein
MWRCFLNGAYLQGGSKILARRWRFKHPASVDSDGNPQVEVNQTL